MQDVKQALLGKTITGVISRPGKNGVPELLMLALEDGSYMQFVVPSKNRRSQRKTSSYQSPPHTVDLGTVSAPEQQLPLIHGTI